MAEQFAALGYPTLVLADSDRPLDRTDEDLAQLGVEVIKWPGEVNTETRLNRDLPLEALKQLDELARLEWGADSVSAHLANAFGCTTEECSSLEALLAEKDEKTCRERIAETAHRKSWAKRVDYW